MIAYALYHYYRFFHRYSAISHSLNGWLFDQLRIIDIRNLRLFVADEIIRLCNKSINYFTFDCVQCLVFQHSGTAFFRILFSRRNIYISSIQYMGLCMCVLGRSCALYWIIYAMFNHTTKPWQKPMFLNKYYIIENRSK